MAHATREDLSSGPFLSLFPTHTLTLSLTAGVADRVTWNALLAEIPDMAHAIREDLSSERVRNDDAAPAKKAGSSGAGAGAGAASAGAGAEAGLPPVAEAAAAAAAQASGAAIAAG
jgi:hypothetical protein